MTMVKIDVSKCIGCGNCVDVCPNDVLDLDAEGIATVVRPEECEECGTCEAVCTQNAIRVEEYAVTKETW